MRPVNSLKIQWKHLIISFNETSEFTQNIIKILYNLVQWDQWIHSKSNESTQPTKDTFLVMILKLLKTFWAISTFSKEKFVTFYHSRFLEVRKWRLLFSHQSVYPSIHPSKHPQHAIHPNIHPSEWRCTIDLFHWRVSSTSKLCNNMILFLWKAEIISVLIAGLDLDVSGSKYAPLFILHLYFYFAARNSYDTEYGLGSLTHEKGIVLFCFVFLFFSILQCKKIDEIFN